MAGEVGTLNPFSAKNTNFNREVWQPPQLSYFATVLFSIIVLRFNCFIFVRRAK
jgi:hypothetical protein